MNPLLAMAAVEPTPICDIVTKYPLLSGLLSEDILNHELAPLLPGTASNEINLSRSCIKTDYMPIFDTLIRSIEFEKIIPLFDEAKSFHQTTSPHIHHITALKIHFGIYDCRILPLFQPLYITLDAVGKSTNVIKGKMYVYVDEDLNGNNLEDDAIFLEANREEIDSLALYKKSVKIKHDISAGYNTFRYDRDTEAVIFSFQTIFTLMFDNSNFKKLHLHNAMRVEKGELQHCIILSAQKTPIHSRRNIGKHKILGPIYQNRYANRSHLCPPDTFTFNLASLGPTTCP